MIYLQCVLANSVIEHKLKNEPPIYSNLKLCSFSISDSSNSVDPKYAQFFFSSKYIVQCTYMHLLDAPYLLSIKPRQYTMGILPPLHRRELRNRTKLTSIRIWPSRKKTEIGFGSDLREKRTDIKSGSDRQDETGSFIRIRSSKKNS